MLPSRRQAGAEKHGLFAHPLLTASPGIASYGVSGYAESRASGPRLVRGASESDFRLRAASPCVDRAVVIRGINEDYVGRAPDIGAIEYGRP